VTVNSGDADASGTQMSITAYDEVVFGFARTHCYCLMQLFQKNLFA